jgi:hypothetical protein
LRTQTYQHHLEVKKTAQIQFPSPVHLLFGLQLRILWGNRAKVWRTFVPTLLLCAFAIPLHAQEQEQASVSSGVVTDAVAEAQTRLTASSRVEPTAPVNPSTIAPKNDRLFYVMPNYLTVETQQQFRPLPASTKFKLSAKTMTDPITVSFIGAIALIGQARNSDPSYGQGVRGYAKRYGTFYADTGIGTLMTTSVFPTLLHQDPRYFQLGRGGVWHRTMYSVSRIFVARGDNGELQFNTSEIAGNAVAAGISNTYHPQNQRTLGNTVRVFGTTTMLNALCNVAKEFWPDLRRKLHKSKSD